MSEVTPQDVETALRTGAVDDYCLAAALTMYLFDRCLCVDQEIACIWRRRHSIPSVVYILLHSVTISNLGLLVIQNFLNMDCSSAWPEYIVAMAVGGLYYLTLAIISSLRVYAISLGYGTPSLRLVVSLVVFALSLGQVAYRIFYSVTLIAFPAPLVGCEIGSVVDYGTAYIIAQVASIAADAIILIVTWCRSFRAMQLARAMSVPAPLYTLLLRDGTIHFGLLAIFNLLSAAFYRSNILLGFFYLATVFTTIILSHLFLNLRGLGAGNDSTVGDAVYGCATQSYPDRRILQDINTLGGTIMFMENNSCTDADHDVDHDGGQV